MRAPQIETFWIFTTARNNWRSADHMCSCKKQLEWPKSLRVAVGWPCASGVPFKICGNSLVATACIWLFECNPTFQFLFSAPLWNILNICKEWVGTSWPYVQLQETIKTTKVFEKLQWLGLAPKLKSFLQNCGNSLVATASKCMFECRISMQWAPFESLKHSEN